jgi:benzoyl-CoA reductase/2-hydroxyglutaryl-CoA dehydratase subunit BcrC/BadD/HgdB
MFANANLTTEPLNMAEAQHYSRDTCSFLRCTVGAAIKNYLPAPDFLVATSHYCDGATKAFYNLSRLYKKKFFLLDTPYDYDTREAVDYLAKQLEDMVKEIEKITARKMDADKLAQTLRFSNQAREYLLKVNELRRNIPSPILGGEAIDYAIMLAHTWGTAEIVQVYKCLYEELKERVDHNIGATDEERYRLLWRNLRPYYNDTIIDYLENKCKARVVFEEVNYLHWKELNPEDPYRSLAYKLLSNPPLGPLKHWINETIGVLRDYKINGIIEFAHWGCRHLNTAIQMVKETIDKEKIPILVLDGDCLDGRDYSEGQIMTRIDTFLKTLENVSKVSR